MEIVQERNYSHLMGKFTGIEYEGKRIKLMTFKDNRFGNFAIGVYHSESIEIDTPYQITVSVHGKVRIKDGRTFTNNCLYLVSYEKETISEAEQTKINQLKGDN